MRPKEVDLLKKKKKSKTEHINVTSTHQMGENIATKKNQSPSTSEAVALGHWSMVT